MTFTNRIDPHMLQVLVALSAVRGLSRGIAVSILVALADNQCVIDVAVPDCEGTQSAGGGACTRT